MHCLRPITLFLLTLLPVLAVSSPALAKVPRIIVSVPPQAYFVKRLAGDLVSVDVMLPAGVNHETYEPTMGKLNALSRASVYFKLGHPHFHLESVWLAGVLKGAPEIRVVDSLKGVPVMENDLHVWLSPRLVRKMLPALSAELQTLLPGAAAVVKQNTEAFDAELQALDSEIGEKLKPHVGKAFFVFHSAWGYYAGDFGLIQLVLETDGKEPGFGAKQVVERARKAGVRVLIVEPPSSQSTAGYVSTQLNIPIKTVDPLAADWKENLLRMTTLLLEDFEKRTAAPAEGPK